MSINVSELLTDPDFTRTISRRRPTSSLANEGEATNTYGTATSVVGAVQPAKLSDVQFLPEGARLSDTMAFFTAADVSAGDGRSQLPDMLIDGTATYRVLHLEDFRNNGYVRVLALRVPVEVGG
jgi:hypothetical protein